MSMKNIEELVYNGNVLDNNGTWIPISTKIKQEKNFLTHLIRGEVLHDGIWITFEELRKKTDYPSNTPVLVEDTSYRSLETLDTKQISDVSEETISISSEQITPIVAQSNFSESETNFPPETTEFKIEEPTKTFTNTTPIHNNLSEDILFDGQTVMDFSLDDLQKNGYRKIDAVGNYNEFDETVMFNIRSIQAKIDEKNRKNNDEKQ